ncbi:hypothetical protein EVAR_436_1 [Eumeta japonica]|uniref:Uncharacterized protein n=1 Tax=Eumeta variegata TaxID=151549 RepID=A0A4C1SA64_EUMVA|nr:hypothetical protein EVAR_436_1 [Eumeta japonica]
MEASACEGLTRVEPTVRGFAVVKAAIGDTVFEVLENPRYSPDLVEVEEVSRRIEIRKCYETVDSAVQKFAGAQDKFVRLIFLINDSDEIAGEDWFFMQTGNNVRDEDGDGLEDFEDLLESERPVESNDDEIASKRQKLMTK